jgi:hypothetical protein
MRLRLFIGIVAFFIVMSLAIAIVLVGLGRLLSNGNIVPQSASGGTATSADNVIARENAQLGTRKWEIPVSRQASTQIQAYAGATSVTSGDKLTFYVSTATDSARFSVEIYRLGWYGGDGGRLMTSQTNLIGRAQGYFNEATHALANCQSCRVDSSTGLVEANWQPSYSLTIPSDWTTGIYLAKFSLLSSGEETYAPFDVRGNAHSTYVAVTSDNTYQAYNNWGGYSLYEAEGAASTSEENGSSPKGVMVSFNRPYANGRGSGEVLTSEIDAIRWLERQGYDLSYISSVDLHENPGQLIQHRAYISLGHDEYWSKEMRDGVENARDQGVGLLFLGADAAYWQMRYSPDGAGVPDRTIVCYKVETVSNTLARDPFYGEDNSRVTARWRDPVLNRPENALIGIMYSDLTHQRLGYPWQVDPQVDSPLLAGTGLLTGQQYGCNLVGYEWDRVFTNNASPKNLQILSTSHPSNDQNSPDVSNTTYYIASSGAMVFATGSIYWMLALDDYRFTADPACVNQSHAVPEMQKLMANVMTAIVILHPTG